MNRLDRALLEVFPRWTISRIKARYTAKMMARYYEAAQPGRRTQGWRRSSGDANAVNGPAISVLREHARDLDRNNPWARRGRQVIANHMVSWGIAGSAIADGAGKRSVKRANEIWRDWAGTTQCDYEGQRNIYGFQKLGAGTVPRDGEFLIRRRRQPSSAGLVIPLQLQALEADFIDTLKDGETGAGGGPIVQGVEYDRRGRRVAYWLYKEHPGSVRAFGGGGSLLGQSERVPAEDIIHMYRIERAGQVRGVSWYAPVIVSLKDHDEYEDATLMKQKIAACFAAFITDIEGDSAPVGTEKSADGKVEQLEPGLIHRAPMGSDVKFANPPSVNEHDSYSKSVLRKIAAGLGVTVEDLTGDYQRMPFSAARMSRISHWNNVHDWQWMMMIPQLCDPVWVWAMEAAQLAGLISEIPAAKWTPPPMPMIEPDKEGLAYVRLVRSGAMTHDEMVRQMGQDPDTHWDEYKAALDQLDERGIVLDSDARKTSQTGQLQKDPADSAAGSGAEPDPEEDPDDEDEPEDDEDA